MTVYNGVQYLCAAIDSVLSQDLESLELILVDDGSTEDIETAIAPYRGKLKLIRQSRQGVGAARDAGVAAASADLVAFCDADDIQHTYRLSMHAALLNAFPEAALVFSDLSMFEARAVTTHSTLRERKLGIDTGDFESSVRAAFGPPTSCRELGIAAPSEHLDAPVYFGRATQLIASRHVAWGAASMFRKSKLIEAGPHYRGRCFEDWSVVSRISKQNDLVFWDVPVLWYRQHPTQNTQQDTGVLVRAYRDVVVDVWKDDPGLRDENPGLQRDLIHRAYLQNAHYAMLEGDYARARADILACIGAIPWSRVAYTQLVRCGALQAADLLRRSLARLLPVAPKRSYGTVIGLAAMTTVLVTASFIGYQIWQYAYPGSGTGVSSESVAASELVEISAESMFTAWSAGDIGRAHAESQALASSISALPVEARDSLLRQLVGFSISIGRIDEARRYAAHISSAEYTIEMEAAIAFATGDMERTRDHLGSVDASGDAATALLMAIVGLGEPANNAIAALEDPDHAALFSNVIAGITAMQSGNTSLAESLFAAATEELSIDDGGYYFVAMDMLAKIRSARGDTEAALALLENTMQQRDPAIRNGSGIFWLMCQRNLAAMYREAGSEDAATDVETMLRERLALADPSFPLANSLSGA